MSRQYYVLQNYPDIQEIFERIEDALDEAHQLHGFLFLYAGTEDQQNVRIHIWLEEKHKRAVVKLADDREIGVCYLIVESTTLENTTLIAGLLVKHVRYRPLIELQREAIQGMEENPQKLVILALGAGETFDQVSFDILSDGLRHLDSRVRNAASTGCYLTRWVAFVPALAALSQNDPVSEVRETAHLALLVCRPPSSQPEASQNNEGDRTP